MTNVINLPKAIVQRPIDIYLLSLSHGSRRAAWWRLELFFRLMKLDLGNWHQVTYTLAVNARASLCEDYAASTVNATLAAFKGAARQAFLLNKITQNEYSRLTQIKGVAGNHTPVGRWLHQGELRSLFQICNDDAQGDRDRALLAILFGAGLRRSEAAALRVKDLTDEGLKVLTSKNNRSRMVPLSRSVRAAIEVWINVLEEPAPSSRLLRRVYRSGRIGEDGISGEAIRKTCNRLAATAGIASFRPHDARRSYASSLLDAGADLSVVARLLGHSDVQVTMTYDRRTQRAEADAAALIVIPEKLAEAMATC